MHRQLLFSAFVKIADVQPNVQPPRVRQGGSAGTFTVDCDTNGNGRFSPDNPLAQPGVKNGNLSISVQSGDESLEDSDTTCRRNGDKSSYFWSGVRNNKNGSPPGASQDSLKTAGTSAISCIRERSVRRPGVALRLRNAIRSGQTAPEPRVLMRVMLVAASNRWREVLRNCAFSRGRPERRGAGILT